MQEASHLNPPVSHSGAHSAIGSAAAKRRSPNAWVVIASLALTAFTTFVLLDTFAIARVQQSVQEADLSSIVAAQNAQSTQSANASDTTGESENSGTGDPGGSQEDAAIAAASDSSDDSNSGHSHGSGSHHHRPGGKGDSSTGSSGKSGSSSSSGKSSATADLSQIVAGAASAATVGTQIGAYSDDNMQITVSSVRAYDTDIYVADIQVSSAEYLKTALAQNSFGRNLKDTTSNMAEENGAVLAINGDYYGFRDDGYVLRNGVLYRDTAAESTDALVIYGDGAMASVNQSTTSAQELKDSGAWQVLSFGPTLVNGGSITVAADEEVSQSRSSNPRTAIGMISPLHYVVVVSDGRTGDNEGLTLYELAQVLVDNGATYAYNLDGGGSTTLYFKGEVLNNPTSGNIGGERSVSDIVYFG